jgi:hypothetical protein
MGESNFLVSPLAKVTLYLRGPSKLSLMGGFCHEGRQRCGSRPAERQLRPIPREPAARRHLANYRTRDDIGALLSSGVMKNCPVQRSAQEGKHRPAPARYAQLSVCG